MRIRGASPAFALVVLIELALVGVIGVVLLYPGVISGVLGHQTAGHIGEHFRVPHHRVHDFTFGFIFSTATLGMLAQLRNPSGNAAGQLMAVVPWIALLLAFTLARRWLVFAPAPLLGGLTLAAALLHPSVLPFFRAFSAQQLERTLLALTAIAAVPLLGFAFRNVALQRTLTNDHAMLGHYGFMAAFSFTVIGTALVTSMRPTGWRLAAWTGGLLPILLGLVSLVYPTNDSSLRAGWAIASFAWGAAFIATAELRVRRDAGAGR